MPQSLTRRSVLISGIAASALVACGQADTPELIDFSALEARAGGRVAVAAMNLATGDIIANRGEERFAMCSSFKWLLGGIVLHRVERGEEQLDREIPIRSEDLVFYSPVTELRADLEPMSVGELCAATIGTSDNTAANLLLETLGGPDGFTRHVREFGDEITRLDRLEPELNENAPGDPRDTSTPLAMLSTMQTVLFGDALSEESKTILRRWMIDASTGLSRLRAGLPKTWLAGDKTGTSSNDQSNDVAFAIAPEGSGGTGPILIVSYINAPEPMSAALNTVHADIAREVCRVFGA